MKKAAYILFLFISFAVFDFGVRAQSNADVYEDISRAIRSGDSRQIASLFGSSIDLTLLNQEDVYSKAQAELMIKDFFLKNPPKTFTIVHKGSSKEGTLFAVGNLAST